MIYVNLTQLDHSPVNVRTNEADKTDVKSLAASIAAHGLLQPLVVTQDGDSYHVVAGNRRLAALRSLDYSEGVPVTVIEETLAREASLAENIIRRNLTPLELYEAIAALGDEGDTMSQKDIAARFGQSIDFVRRAQRLGRVHPTIRDAYREGQIDDTTIKAYAASPDPEEQLSVYEQIKELHFYGSPAPKVRELLGFGSYSTKQMLERVGEDRYKKAGGKIETDLFGDNKRVSDLALLSRLNEEIIVAEDNELADQLGIERIDDTEGWWRAWPKMRGSAEDEERIADICETLREDSEALSDEARDALYDEREVLEDKRVMVLPNREGTYAVYKGHLYEKIPQASETQEADEDTADECEPPAEDALKPSQKALDTLNNARQHRRIDVLAGGAAGFEAERFAFCALRCAFRHQLKGGTWLALNGPMKQADWLSEGDDAAAWELFLQDETRGAVIHGSIGNLINAGQDNPLIDSWAADCPQPAWTSSPEFWDLFRKKDQLLALIGEFAPRLAELYENSKTSDIRANAHALCTGEECNGVPTKDERAAAEAWVPSWLRFEGEG